MRDNNLQYKFKVKTIRNHLSITRSINDDNNL